MPTMCKILSNILLSRLITYAEEVIGDRKCGFRRKRSTADHIFCIRQILEKKWEYNEAVHQLFIYFMKVYDSVSWEVLYYILIEFGVPKKLVRLIIFLRCVIPVVFRINQNVMCTQNVVKHNLVLDGMLIY